MIDLDSLPPPLVGDGPDSTDVHPIDKIEKVGFVISYYEQDDSNPIKIAYDNRVLILGVDIEFGDQIPLDSDISVPENSGLVLSCESMEYRILNFEGNLRSELVYANIIYKTEDFQKAVSKEKAKGVGLATLGGVIAIGSLYIASKAGPSATSTVGKDGFLLGASLFAYGLKRALGDIRQSVYMDLIDSIQPPEAELTQAWE